MTGKMRLFVLFALTVASCAAAQKPAAPPAADTTYEDYDDLFNELDALLDSLTAPRSFVLFNIGAGSNYFNTQSRSGYTLESTRRFTCTPSISYYGRSGFGISASSVIVNDGERLNPYQFYFTGSYDYLKNKSLLAGAALTHFVTKRSLPFYTSPLRNEVSAYVTYKKFWLKPSVSVSYGWGRRSDYEQRRTYITALRLAPNGFTRIRTRESINDFSVTTSVRHDFYWMNILGSDYVRVTPQLVFNSGTQKFGFNQTSNTYATIPRTGANFLYSSDKVHLDDRLFFQPLSLSTYLKAEYSKGKFFVQPQLIFDYYFPATTKNLATAFVINAGVIF